MPTPQLTALCDLATEAHTRIQQTFEELDPVVGVSENMRADGVPADVMTIDCLKSGKRILLILHDHQPDLVHYQFDLIEPEQHAKRKFEQIPIATLTAETLFDWIKGYFPTSRAH